MFFMRIGWKILGVLLLELQLIVTPLCSLLSALNIFIQYFAVKWKAPCWTQQDRKFFTGDLWTLVNRCYKAACFSCAFKHDDRLNTYNSNSATSIDFYLRKNEKLIKTKLIKCNFWLFIIHGISMIKLLKTVLSLTYYQKHVSCETND